MRDKPIESGSNSSDNIDDIDDMYLDYPEGDGRTLRTASSTVSFRSAASILDQAEDVEMEDAANHATPLTSNTRAAEQTTDPVAQHVGRMHYKDPDLITEIRGMYRILDLVSEQGSGGLVDKIVISQDALGTFMNDLRRGTYTSMTRVDFAGLDEVTVKPRGIYGSRFEIVRFMQDLGTIDNEVATLLRNCRDDASTNSGRTLRSGLYMLRATSQSLVYAIFWPEESTWNDDATSAAQKNRVTFMRYLTKISDQILALISEAHGAALQWNDEDAGIQMDTEEEDIGRLFTFEVEKTNEQEEQAAVRPGFTVDFAHLAPHAADQDADHVDPNILIPRLVPGETTCGILYTTVVRPRKDIKLMTERCTRIQLDTYLTRGSFRIDPEISDAALDLFVEAGLGQTQIGEETLRFRNLRKAASDTYTTELQQRLDDLKQKIVDHNALLVSALQGVIADAAANKFSIIDREQLLEKVPTKEESQAEREKRNPFPNGIKNEKLILWFELQPLPKEAESRPETSQTDAEFLQRLPIIAGNFPVLVKNVEECAAIARLSFANLVKRKCHEHAKWIQDQQKNVCEQQIKHYLDSQLRSKLQSTRQDYLAAVADKFVRNPNHVVVVKDFQVEKRFRDVMYHIAGHHEVQSGAALEYAVHELQLTQSDRHQLQLDQAFVPTPQIARHTSVRFKLSMNHHLKHIQLLRDGRCLAVTETDSGHVKVFVDRCQEIDRAIEFDRSRKQLHREKIGQDFLLAFDESKRMLAVCGTEKKSLNVFIFDEKYTSAQALGSPVDFRSWYDDHTRLAHMAILCGQSEELVLVDEHAIARMYSLTTQQFRPASLQLLCQPIAIHSSPDGSCLVTTECDSGGQYLRVYHWTSFGSTDGICLDLGEMPAHSSILTSMDNPSQMHYVGMDVDAQRCNSLALDVTRRVTEFMFKEKGGRAERTVDNRATAHNCLIECFADVWTRFPVVPAVQRETLKATNERKAPSIIFVSDIDPSRFQSHFREIIAQFERNTQKPTGGKLKRIIIDAIPYSELVARDTMDISSFKAGEWLVDILCLIPIHVAVTRDNRFIPLKDGVWSAELERTLLGATVGQIVDNLTFGWYESIFGSYMATKVLHVARTSCIIDGIERSAQEDTLLVLFNTALSNLVLFRNNFALSRDIAGLFQSFQSSSTILDPASNPTLFRSMLVIIIKDVVESDKNEIRKEFQLKFRKIVELEQGSNFISRLHGGKLTIIPWPVIQSSQFYTLFPSVKKILDAQDITHPKAGVFLQTMKTLMAKLKANDWGALDQNLAAHRAQQLSALLPSALATGAAELEPEIEPLKDFDSGTPIQLPDTRSLFYLFEGDDLEKISSHHRELHLQALLETAIDADQFDTNQGAWVKSLQDRLERLAVLRINIVREWLDVNTARFNPDLSQLQEVRRAFDNVNWPAYLRTITTDLMIAIHRTNALIYVITMKPTRMVSPVVYLLVILSLIYAKSQLTCVGNFAIIMGNPDVSCNVRKQDHACGAQCEMDGICLIETAPQSIEATFTGAHETFQYTKYSQANKRLPCVIRVPPGELSHTGKHVHSTEKKIFHFCETRCEQCGYFCTLPLGHPQQEHETSHGSMSRTRWAVEGPEGTIVEVNGRKFASRDDGAPMLVKNIWQMLRVYHTRPTALTTYCTNP
ncbi:hypothetical protein EUX98_g8249 [Antrodiella citrinella]|uniref:Uncharacterized protein n=1 Tax=Antrodiella citrinella TaxID=2447956 RepID=A0A4V3XGN7_9APHY|nr:hypothetical protein EUX98_g8249 [Antrodiella citrinella]